MGHAWRRALCAALLSLACAAPGRAAVEVLSITVDRGRDLEASGLVSYHQTVLVRLRLTTLGNLDCLQITDPAGDLCVVTAACQFSDQGDAQAGLMRYVYATEDNRTATLGFRESFMAAAPRAGTYRLRIESEEGADVNLTTASTPVVPTSGPTLAEPAPDAVIDSTAPTFTWTNWTGTTNVLQVREEGNTTFTSDVADDMAQLWRATTGTRTSAAYNYDGSAARAALLLGHAYLWQLASTHIDGQATDPPTTLSTTQLARRRFSVYTSWTGLPALPGELAISSILWGGWTSGSDALRSYTTDLRDQTWPGPESSYDPVWAQDGSLLVYMRNGTGLWVDRLNDSPPVRLPVLAIADPSLSPDAQRVVYTAYDLQNSVFQLRLATLDGRQDTLLLQAASTDEVLRWPVWSPDGAWIAYITRSSYSQSGQLRLLHPDGTGDQPVAAAGVAGYGGYTVAWMEAPSWSPDAQKLALAFSADAPDGLSFIWGIGVLPRAGGVITPVFIAPAAAVCCAAPTMPAWSPSGTSIVFVSGHHLPPDPDWPNGKFETGVEAWVVKANGSGEPTRLTYNYSYDSKAAWWAPLAFPDVPRGAWAFNAINACAEADIVHGYWDGYHPEWTVDRAQMAGFISRVLTGGAVPDPAPGTQSFTDVPPAHWAYAFIEYCKAQNIVGGYGADYRPEAAVDRGQMAGFIARAMSPLAQRPDLPGYTPPTTPSFSDVPTGFWAYKFIEFCHARGVVGGYWDGYHPEIIVTRDQMAVFIGRAFALPM